MKRRKINKLSLNKSTVANLKGAEMNTARGGVWSYESCYFTEQCDTNFPECTELPLCECSRPCTMPCPLSWDPDDCY